MLLLRCTGCVVLLFRVPLSKDVRTRTRCRSEICLALAGMRTVKDGPDGPEYWLPGFFDGLVESRSKTQPREGDEVVFDCGRFRGVVSAVAASEGWMQVRVDLGAGKVGTQVLGWPAPTSACPRKWELVHSSPRGSAVASSSICGEQNQGSRGESRHTGQHRPPSSDLEREMSEKPTKSSKEHRSFSRKRSRKEQIESDEAELVAMQHKCAKYRKKLSNSESMGVEAKAVARLTPREREDYENKLQYWENKLRKWNARAEKRASAKRRERLRREREREQERDRVKG